MSDPEKKSTARSPLSGCAILVIALCVVVFLVFFSTWVLFRQFDEIVKFTEGQQTKVPLVVVADRSDDLRDLNRRVSDFREKLRGDQAVELELSPDDMNLAIAAWQPLQELRETFFVEAFEEGQMVISISFPMNGKPRFARDDEPGWVVSDSRYLEGTMIATPSVSGNEVVLRIKSLVVTDSKVPQEFLEQMSPYRITERYVSDPAIGPEMAQLTRVEIRNGRLVLIRDPAQKKHGYIDDETVDSSKNRFMLWFGVAACLFLIVAGLIVFAGLRKSAPTEI